MGGEQLLDLPKRRLLYDIVREYPGIGPRRAQRILGIGWGETVYHLDRLTEAGLLDRERRGYRDHYYVAGVPFADRGLLRISLLGSGRHLLIALLEQPRSTVPDLSRRTGLSEGRLSIHLRRLVENDLVRTGREGRFRTFELTQPQSVVRVLATYRESLADLWVDRVVDVWSELFRP
jgi:DNA-binding transcriptional ArsR family regulator